MTAFLDASAVVKLYANEAGATAVRRVKGPLVVSALSRVEVASALWRKHRDRQVALEEVSLLLRVFEADLAGTADDEARFVVVPVSTRVLAEAARLLAWLPLRAGDAIQVGAATLAREVDSSVSLFVTFDQHLATAAAAEGFDVRGRG